MEATDDGHCGLPIEELVKLAVTLLEVDESVVRTALSDELSGGEVVADTIDNRPCVFLRGLYLAERGIADRLQALAQGSPPWPKIDMENHDVADGLLLSPSGGDLPRAKFADAGHLAARMRKMASSSVVLPTPGPPVTTATFERSTISTAARCDGLGG